MVAVNVVASVNTNSYEKDEVLNGWLLCMHIFFSMLETIYTIYLHSKPNVELKGYTKGPSTEAWKCFLNDHK